MKRAKGDKLNLNGGTIRQRMILKIIEDSEGDGGEEALAEKLNVTIQEMLINELEKKTNMELLEIIL